MTEQTKTAADMAADAGLATWNDVIATLERATEAAQAAKEGERG